MKPLDFVRLPASRGRPANRKIDSYTSAPNDQDVGIFLSNVIKSLIKNSWDTIIVFPFKVPICDFSMSFQTLKGKGKSWRMYQRAEASSVMEILNPLNKITLGRIGINNSGYCQWPTNTACKMPVFKQVLGWEKNFCEQYIEPGIHNSYKLKSQ